MKRITIEENGIYMVVEINEKQEPKLLHFSSVPLDEAVPLTNEEKTGFRMVEINLSGLDRPLERHGTKYIVTAPGYRLVYLNHKDYYNTYGRKLEFELWDEETKIKVICHYQFYTGISVVRCYTEVTNTGEQMQILEYVSSFNLTGIEKEGHKKRDDKMYVSIPHNSWQREMQWQTYSLIDLGIGQSQPDKTQRSSKAIGATNTGNWSTKEYLPMGYLENQEVGTNLFWQIEHNGSWHWEISDQTGHLYLQLSGPTETESHWHHELVPGETFVSALVAVGVNTGNFNSAMAELTKYRRVIRRKNQDNEKLGVIFNDYMNCLWGNPTTEKELPMIDAAAQAGCEYYCIDAGWYHPGDWWDNVGEWLPSKERFPGGLKEVMDYIRSKNMIPGVWLEIEVMGIHCPLVQKVNEDWFFRRHGKKIYDRSRYQLDFRNPEVVAHADSVIDRLVNEYGVGYIKMDYNIEPGIGTEWNACSYGSGLLGHERAYLAWLDRVFHRCPDLIIENCSSGGLRIDYAMLARHSIQSTSDMEDYRYYATIACNSPAGLTPEQAAVWSYPLTDGDREEVIFNMVNAMLLRIHQSGHLVNLTHERKELVHEALRYYKKIRSDIKEAVPFWPIGLSKFRDTWVCLGLKTKTKAYLAIWRRDGEEEEATIPLKELGVIKDIQIAYPVQDSVVTYQLDGDYLRVKIPLTNCARLFEVKLCEEQKQS